MAELKCGVVKCAYNKDSCCAKGAISVGGKHANQKEDTCCESFIAATEGKVTSACGCSPKAKINIDCAAVNCVYNSNCKCQADHVDIRGNHAEESCATVCATFSER